ncbi:ferric reductase-like transmembrane domain-containing protein [Falsiroseomonas sp. E2-1-a20]|uniref:ferric reductase-like transmembrane domain-containing protein n=1 Tax=Falsiroseomonas sp. E2-1-a20 TaxID=3239300 RepID=UPI003F413A01
MPHHGSRPTPPIETGRKLSVAAALLGFVLLAWLPLLLALAAAEEPGGWHEEAGIALGLVGLSLLLLQFAHSGRWNLVSGRSGIDVTMRFHRAAAILVLVMVLLHPVLFVLPLLLDDPARGLARLHAMFTSPRMTTGKIAWIALVATVLLALGRRVVPYQHWRLLHGLGALGAAGAGVWHALEVGLYSSFPPLGALWWAGLVGAALLLAWAWGWKPWRAARAGWRIGAVTPVGPGYWDVTVTGPTPPRFAAGQFFWLAFGRAAPLGRQPLLGHVGAGCVRPALRDSRGRRPHAHARYPANRPPGVARRAAWGLHAGARRPWAAAAARRRGWHRAHTVAGTCLGRHG